MLNSTKQIINEKCNAIKFSSFIIKRIIQISHSQVHVYAVKLSVKNYIYMYTIVSVFEHETRMEATLDRRHLSIGHLIIFFLLSLSLSLSLSLFFFTS